ncbi:MAG: cytochrome C oxidase subunit IV family protein [bacterium]|nr:cytochrome C oxidase subunit IV family protein [bacterium]
MAHHGSWKRLGDGSLLTEDADEGLGHIVPTSTYNKVFTALLCLTILTVLAATMHFGAFNLAIAIAIAVLKASLVVLFFMHVRWEGVLIWTIVLYPIIVLILLFLGTLGDLTVKTYVEPLKNAQTFYK